MMGQSDEAARRVEAMDTLRTLEDQVILTPSGGRLEIDVQGDPCEILAVSAQGKNPAELATGAQVKMVAGAGFEPAAFRL
jgi:site-specific DNA recombinase